MRYYFTRYTTAVLGQSVAVDAGSEHEAKAKVEMGLYDEVGDEFTANVIGDSKFELEAE